MEQCGLHLAHVVARGCRGQHPGGALPDPLGRRALAAVERLQAARSGRPPRLPGADRPARLRPRAPSRSARLSDRLPRCAAPRVGCLSFRPAGDGDRVSRSRLDGLVGHAPRVRPLHPRESQRVASPVASLHGHHRAVRAGLRRGGGGAPPRQRGKAGPPSLGAGRPAARGGRRASGLFPG